MGLFLVIYGFWEVVGSNGRILILCVSVVNRGMIGNGVIKGVVIC